MELYRQDNWQHLNLRIHKISQLSQYLITMGLGLWTLENVVFYVTSSTETVINLHSLSYVC